ncbi:T9SS C-terminal target domain-containing protein [Sphingobacteriales bacterium UPWRP_1]|nr:hypothetical protein B6N25_00585 [Sphingobacteriales bacterium TSM_CSS]PSJ71978.1 T9SS C-terminal target domain-containing protein [Sphingobacteriales bacterium UPWRP_1]
MKNILRFTAFAAPVLALLLCTAVLQAQNAAPVISNILAFPDELNNRVTVTFDVADAENDALEIELRVSDNMGQTYLVDVSETWGDVGYPVSAGSGKTLTWQYNPVALTSGIYFLKIIADDRQPIDIQAIVNEVNPNNLYNDLEFVQGIRHYDAGLEHIQEVKDAIETRFTNAGLQTHRQDFSVGAFSGQNIIGRLQGQGNETQTVIIDAHFDSVAVAPGADDNGSGVVGVLEALRVLSPYQFRNNIKFIGFDLEELGLLGSNAFINSPGGKDAFETISGVLNFEMIGYYSEVPNSQSTPIGFNLLFPDAYAELTANQFRGDFLINVANAASAPLRNAFDSCAALYVPALKVTSLTVPGNGEIATDLRRSDHAKFWDAGMQALMLTDGANFRNIHYHTPTDVLDILDFNFMSNNVKATVATAAHLAGIRHCSTAVTAFNLITGIENPVHHNNINFTLQPNPAGNSTMLILNNIYTKFLQADIYNACGNLIMSKQIAPDAGNAANLLRTDALANGVYFVVLHNGQHKGVQKLIINK